MSSAGTVGERVEVVDAERVRGAGSCRSPVCRAGSAVRSRARGPRAPRARAARPSEPSHVEDRAEHRGRCGSGSSGSRAPAARRVASGAAPARRVEAVPPGPRTMRGRACPCTRSCGACGAGAGAVRPASRTERPTSRAHRGVERATGRVGHGAEVLADDRRRRVGPRRCTRPPTAPRRRSARTRRRPRRRRPGRTTGGGAPSRGRGAARGANRRCASRHAAEVRVAGAARRVGRERAGTPSSARPRRTRPAGPRRTRPARTDRASARRRSRRGACRSGSRGRAPDRARVETLREILELRGRSATARTRDTPRPLRLPLRRCAAEARVLRHFRPVGEPAEPVGVVFGRSCDRLERRLAAEPHGRAGRRVRRASGSSIGAASSADVSRYTSFQNRR